MGSVRLCFVFAVGLSAWVLLGAPLALPAWSQEAPAPKGEYKPEAVPQPQPKTAAPKAQPKRAPAASKAERSEDNAAAKKPGPPPSCGWIGKRVIQSLLRDDAVTAQDFDRLYRAFDCSGEHIRLAFDCTVSDGAPQTANEAQLRLDACWEDPSATKIEVPASGPPKATQAPAPGTGTSQSKGSSGGKAPAESSSTPNYPKGK